MAKKKIMIATANPDDSSNIRTDRFVSAIQKGIAQAEKSELYDIVPILATDLDSFLKQLENQKPAILVLVGHGDRLDRFVFEAKDGGREFAKPDKFADSLASYATTLECVLMMACHSQSLAQKIIQNITYAVGYDEALLVEVAKKYVEWFFFYLANGNDYDIASHKTKTAMLNTIAENQIPNLFVKFSVKDQKILQTPTKMNKDQIIELIESNKLDEAFKQFITLTRGSELYSNFLMPLYVEYKEYKDDKLAGKDVRGKLAGISQRLMQILERYESR
jgi:hypothetical protein